MSYILFIYKGCSLTMNSQQGAISSPGYQLNRYPSNVTCSWHLMSNPGETKPISLRFTDFKLKENSDFVEVNLTKYYMKLLKYLL